MKPAPFAHDAPETLDEAIRLLAEHGDDAKVIAGGQSLIPLLALRFAQPERLVDLGRVEGLAGIRALDDGSLAIGAMTRTRELETSPLVAQRVPLAAQAAPLIAHRQIRNRGTVGGSIAHGDAAAELPAVMVALDATLEIQGPNGTRTVAARDFFLTHFTTALESDEILTELRIPPAPPRTGTAFLEVARRQGDFAMVGAAAVVTRDGDGACTAASVALIGVGDRPVPVAAAAGLAGARVDADRAKAVGDEAANAISPTSDLHAGAEYRKALTRVLVERALLQAAAA